MHRQRKDKHVIHVMVQDVIMMKQCPKTTASLGYFLKVLGTAVLDESALVVHIKPVEDLGKRRVAVFKTMSVWHCSHIVGGMIIFFLYLDAAYQVNLLCHML